MCSIVAKRFPFIGEIISGDQVRQIRWLRHNYGFVFGQTLTPKQQYVSWCVSMVQNPWLHTYIRNWPLQPFSQYYDLGSHTTHVVCVKFIREWWDLQFNVDSKRQIFEKLFHGRFIYSQSFCQKSAERKSAKKYYSYLIFDNWPGIRTRAFASNKPTHYILDQGDFIKSMIGFPQLCAFLTKCFPQSTHNFKVVFLIDRTTLWQDFMMQHAIAIEEGSEQNLHI